MSADLAENKRQHCTKQVRCCLFDLIYKTECGRSILRNNIEQLFETFNFKILPVFLFLIALVYQY